MRTYENTCADCGDTVAAMSEPEPGSSLCYSCATGAKETNLVFVDLNTDTVADCVGAFVIDPDTADLAPGEIDVLDAADTFGAFDDAAADIVRRVGVPVSDLWAAYQREKLRAGDGFRYRHGWQHCDTATEYDDDGVTCRVCYRFMTWDQADERMAG